VLLRFSPSGCASSLFDVLASGTIAAAYGHEPNVSKRYFQYHGAVIDA
jgi:hypothetical protein